MKNLILKQVFTVIKLHTRFGRLPSVSLIKLLAFLYIKLLSPDSFFGQNYANIFYADDMLLLEPPVADLQLLLVWAKDWFGLTRQLTQVSCCLGKEPRCASTCVNLIVVLERWNHPANSTVVWKLLPGPISGPACRPGRLNVFDFLGPNPGPNPG